MIQAVMIGITGVFLALFLKQTKPEYAVCVSAGTGYFAAFSCGRALKSGDRKYPSDSECHFHPERLHSGIAENHWYHLHLRICRRYLSGRRLRCSGRADRRFREAVHSGGQHAYRERAASDDTELPGRVSMDTFTLEQLDFSEIQRAMDEILNQSFSISGYGAFPAVRGAALYAGELFSDGAYGSGTELHPG